LDDPELFGNIGPGWVELKSIGWSDESPNESGERL